METLNPNKRLRVAFTLLEMLVVMCILSALMAVMLPALRMARSMSRGAACMSNLRQIGIALAQYKDIYNDYLPKELFRGDVVVARSAGGWSLLPTAYASVTPEQGGASGATLDRFVKDPRLLLCPSRRNDATPSFGINGRVVDYVYKSSDVKNPTDTPFVFDSAVKKGYYYSDLASRHEGCANLLYMDGHIAPQHHDPVYGFASAVPLPGVAMGLFELHAGTVTNKKALRCEIQVLGAAFGVIGARIPVGIYYSLNNGEPVSVCVNAAQTVAVTITDLRPADTLTILAQPTNSTGIYSSAGGNGRCRSLLDGALVPQQSDDQGTIESFLANYIDVEGRTDIGEDAVLYLFELSDYVVSGSADYQDAVVLVTFYAD